jgi:hypothetical protein
MRDLITEYTEKENPNGATFWSRLADIEDEIGKGLEHNYTYNELIELLRMMRSRKVATFGTDKARISGYLRWVQANGYNVADSMDALAGIRWEDVGAANAVLEMYFKDFDHLQMDITKAVNNSPVIDERQLDTPIAIVYLAWFGATIGEAINVKKSGLGVASNTISMGGRKVAVPESVVQFLVDYAESDGFDSVSHKTRARFFKYKDSQALLRSSRAPALLASSVKNLLAIFSKYYFDREDKLGGKFSYSYVYDSGMYSRIFEYEQQNGMVNTKDLMLVSNLFCEEVSTRPSANIKMREYKRWKETFHGI